MQPPRQLKGAGDVNSRMGAVQIASPDRWAGSVLGDDAKGERELRSKKDPDP